MMRTIRMMMLITTSSVHQVEYDLMMRLAVYEDALKFSYAGNDEDSASAEAEESSVCCIGIEKRLSRAFRLEVKACRARCISAVLAEQARPLHLRWLIRQGRQY